MLSSVRVDERRLRDTDAWYLDIPAVAALRGNGIILDSAVTVVVGENGSGKSTVIEAIAHAWRARLHAAVREWGPEPAAEDTDLHWALVLDPPGTPDPGGCFLRAESMHLLFGETDLRLARTPAYGSAGLNARSHGESFLAFLEQRANQPGLFVLDEPEAALSFTSCLRLLALLDLIVGGGSQVLLATHSPLLAAYPGARILQFTDSGIETAEWDELPLVQDWRAFLDQPERYLRHLFRD